MSQSLANLAIDLTANIAGFQSDLGRANREAEKFARGLERDFGRIGAQIGAALATGITAVSVAVRSTVNELDRLGDASKRIAVSTEALSGLGYAAKLSGSDAAALERGLTKLSRTMADAAAGGERQAAVFDAVGVSITDAEGKLRSADQVFLDLATRFKSYKDGAGEVALAQQLMGKGATALIPLLNEGRDGIASLTDEAERLGVVIGGETVEQAQLFNDNMDRLKAATQGAVNTLTADLLPALVQISTSSAEATVQSNSFRDAATGLATVLEGVAAVVITVKNAVESLVDLLAASVDSIKVVGAVFQDVGRDLGAVAAAQMAVLKGEYAEGFRILQARAEDTGEATNTALNKASAGWSSFASGLSNSWGDIAGTFKAFWGSAEKTSEAAQGAGVAAKQAAAGIGAMRAPLVSVGTAANATGQSVKKAATAANDLAVSIRDLGDPAAELNELLLDQASILGGPFVAAAIKFRDAMLKILELEKRLYDMGPPTLEQIGAIAQARANATEQYGRDMGELASQVASADKEITASAISSAEAFGDAWSISLEDVKGAFSDFLASGLEDFSSFQRLLEQGARNSMDNLVSMIQNAVQGMSAATSGAGAGGAGGGAAGGMGAAGGAGSGALGQWMNAAGSAYAGWQAAGRGNRLGTVVQFTAAGANFGPWGALIGAVVGIIVAFARTVRDPQIRLAGQNGRIERQEGSFDTVFGTIRAGSAAGVKWEQYVDGIKSFDKTIMEMVSSFSGAEPRLQAIRTALSTWSVDFENQSASLENVLKSRFTTILGTFDESIQSFVMGGADLKDQMERFGDALSAEAAFIAAGIDDIDFSQFLTIVEDMTVAGETTGEAVRRIVGGMGLLGTALDVMGVDLGMTGEDFVRFATSITEAAGGLDEAKALWDDYFGTFYSAEELATRGLGALTQSRDSQLTALGLDTSITQAQFRELFESALPSLSAEAVTQWLQAARAIGLVINAEGRLTELRTEEQRNAETLADLIEGLQFDDFLAGLTGAEREIAQIHRQFDGFIAQAIALGASEEQLTELRRLEANAIDRVTDATEASAGAFEDYWATIAQIAADGAAQMLDDLHRAAEQVQSFLNGMALSQNSSLSPQERLAAARAQFLQLAQLAGQGDTNAMGQLAQAAQLLLQEGRNFFGAGAEFSALEAMIRNLLTPFGAIAGSSDLQGAFALLTEAVNRLAGILAGNATPAANGFTASAATANVFTPAGLMVAGKSGGSDGDTAVAELVELRHEVADLRADFAEAAAIVARAIELAGAQAMSDRKY